MAKRRGNSSINQFLVIICLFNLQDVVQSQGFAVGPDNAALETGSTVQLVCYTNATDPDHYWLYTPLLSGTLTIVARCQTVLDYELEQPDPGNCNIVMRNLSMTRAGTYWCSAHSTTPSYTAYLIVMESEVRMTTNNTEEVVEVGEVISITCYVGVRGNNALPPSIEWYPTDYFNISSLYNTTYVTSTILVQADKPNVPQYNCTVLFINFTTSQPFNLAKNIPTYTSTALSQLKLVYYAPDSSSILITGLNPSDNRSALLGSTLTCLAEAYPPVQYYWLTSDLDLVSTGSSLVLTTEGVGLVYECYVNNSRGEGSINVTVDVIAPTTAVIDETTFVIPTDIAGSPDRGGLTTDKGSEEGTIHAGTGDPSPSYETKESGGSSNPSADVSQSPTGPEQPVTQSGHVTQTSLQLLLVQLLLLQLLMVLLLKH